MARYTGSTSKIARRFGEPIYGPDSALQKKNYAPGQHGPSKRRGKKTEYGVQLQEKQKAKYTYGVLERQFSNLFAEAERKPGITGEILIQLLEQRLDNVVFRMGIAPTRRAARQLVNHGHIMVNGKVVNIPSFSVKPGMVIAVRPKSKSLEVITSSLSTRSVSKYGWLEFDNSEMQGKFLNVPDRSEIPENIKEQLIVELYSKQ
ncbi:MAG: 30S ribosomal protein S4 [Bacteroidales bacterium]|jgi:small subunit ribosomal protein S4|nr:30S ribosomal protein S4 [Bacteroidales bacterium]MBR6265673.1 30S ribosomal protein S4 [Bacteroidales bacterium]MCR4800892.1 30S ribosomal protein S4 [Bacteroidales bacterium]